MWFEFDAGRIVSPPSLGRMQRAACQFIHAAADRYPKRLDARLAEHMAAGEDVLGDLAHAAEAGGVANKLGGTAELGEETRDVLTVEAGNLVALGPVHGLLIQSVVERVQVLADFFHPVVEEGFRVKLGEVHPFGEDLTRARLVALFMGRLDVATDVAIEFEAAAEPLVAELIKGFLDGM